MSWLGWLALGVNCGLFVWNVRQLFVVRRIQLVLQQVVVHAWVMRHAPIWLPWCASRGLMFHVHVADAPPPRHVRENWGR